MRKSNSRTRSRLALAGMSTGAIATALLVAPQAAFATDASAVATPSSGPNSGTITVAASTFLNGIAGPLGGYFVPGSGACAVTYTPSTTGAVVAVPTKIDNDSATVAVPATLTLTSGTAKQYTYCIYVGTTAGTSAVAGHATYSVIPLAIPGGGPNSGVVTVSAPSALTGLTSPLGGYFVSGAATCAATYAPSTTGAVLAAPTRVDDNSATVTVPATVTLNSGAAKQYTYCAYAGCHG